MLKKILFEQIQNKDFFWMQAMHEIVCLFLPTPEKKQQWVWVIRTGFLPELWPLQTGRPSSGRALKGFCWLQKCQRGGEEPGTNTKEKKIKVTIVPSYHEVSLRKREWERKIVLRNSESIFIYIYSSSFQKWWYLGHFLALPLETSKDSIS